MNPFGIALAAAIALSAVLWEPSSQCVLFSIDGFIYCSLVYGCIFRLSSKICFLTGKSPIVWQDFIDKYIDDFAVKIAASAAFEFSHSFLNTQASAITSFACHYIIGIRNRDDPRLQWYLFPF